MKLRQGRVMASRGRPRARTAGSHWMNRRTFGECLCDLTTGEEMIPNEVFRIGPARQIGDGRTPADQDGKRRPFNPGTPRLAASSVSLSNLWSG